MTQQAVDLKLFSEVRDYLSKANDDNSAKAVKPMGGFSMFSFPMAPKNKFDEVYKGIILGEASIALKVDELQKLGVTHVVNVSMGKKFNQTNTDSNTYEYANIAFHGIPGLDIMTFKLAPYFAPAADFIDDALSKEGVVYVHCQQGVSRSATIVIAFLMMKRNMDLMAAVKLVREKREILPNDGFLKQLVHLNTELFEEGKV